MNKNRNLIKYFNLRMFDDPEPETTVPENQNQAADFAPAISIDFTSRITDNIQTLQTILGITNMTPMAAGTLIKVYKWKSVTLAEQVAEGEVIPLTKAERILAKTIELTLGKHRRQTTAEAIQKVGRAIGTAKENLNGAYVPASGGDLAQSFNLTADASGLVGMTHQVNSSNASIDTLLFCSVQFYPEYIDGVFKATIEAA